ncbi:unnamed protein product [Sphenostylis stenocarpa]|uniref:Uncharacterized protein n=1 Tax=Sphenostylis stenocarpa TaxID=92480 RepID=A0AA87BBN6_9FABA|nr:unnamed protein product [Sphenostylis stenocarpa]
MCETCAYSIDSPPQWNILPKASSNSYQILREGSKGDEKECFEAKAVSKGHRKSCSCVQTEKTITRVDDEEVPMDLLWEVFNEELSSARGFATSSSSRKMVEFRCTAALTVAKTSTALVETKNRPGMVVIVKNAYLAIKTICTRKENKLDTFSSEKGRANMGSYCAGDVVVTTSPKVEDEAFLYTLLWVVWIPS